MIEITDQAQSYLRGLLADRGDDCGIRINVVHPGTPLAETQIAYCNKGEQQENDQPFSFEGFTAWFEERSVPFLEEARVDFREDRMGGQLTIKAPNARTPNVSADSPIEDRINYVLYNEINPSLAAHGGQVTLVEVTDEQFAVLQFGGGCQGCAAIDITLKQGVETRLMAEVPDLKGITDATDHTNTDNAYY